MTVLCWIGFALALAVTLVWLSRHLMIRRERLHGVVLTDDGQVDPDLLGPLEIVVAAKDEQENIEACLRSLLAQDYPDLHLTVIDDRSEDQTRQIVHRIAAEDARVEVIEIDRLPDGWIGKNHAMHVGVGRTERPWVLMTDADCVFQSPRALAIAMTHARGTGAEMLSVLPRLVTRSFWEHVIQPVCGGVMMIWFHPDKVNDPDLPNAYANGAFILVERETYLRAGGHEAVRREANEDMRLALNVKRGGGALRVVRNQGLYAVRMYEGLGQIVAGWTRIFYGTFGTLRRLGLSLLAVVLVSLYPWIAVASGVGAVAAGASGCWLWLLGAGLLALGVQMTVIWRFYGIVEVPRVLCVTYGLGSLMTAWILLRSMGKLRPGARLTWRGTSYPVGR